MKPGDRKDRRGPPTGTRTGPRARATQARDFGDPFKRAARPDRDETPRERLHVPAGAGIRLDPDVARVFRDSGAVNEALRLVIRLGRLVGGRPAGPPRGPSFRDRPTGAAPRYGNTDRPPRPRKPRFEE